MPVVGHFFVGLVTAASVDPRGRSPHFEGRAAWSVLIVTAAYLPDLAAHALSLTGYSSGRLLGHSLIFAMSSSLAGALLLVGVLPFVRTSVVMLCSIALHDVLDLLQATDRRPFWPWSDRVIALPVSVIPTGLAAEAALFAIPFAGFAIVAWWLRGGVFATRSGGTAAAAPWTARLTPAILAAVLVAAIAVQVLRDRRDTQLEGARDLIEQQHRYAEALTLLDRADRWPSTARPGRADYLRGAAFAGLGDRDRAVTFLLRSRMADPTYFWALADLVNLYADSAAPASVRRQIVCPLVDEMNRHFPAEPARLEVLRRLKRKGSFDLDWSNENSRFHQ